jgi:hypothetical protein
MCEPPASRSIGLTRFLCRLNSRTICVGIDPETISRHEPPGTPGRLANSGLGHSQELHTNPEEIVRFQVAHESMQDYQWYGRGLPDVSTTLRGNQLNAALATHHGLQPGARQPSAGPGGPDTADSLSMMRKSPLRKDAFLDRKDAVGYSATSQRSEKPRDRYSRGSSDQTTRTRRAIWLNILSAGHCCARRTSLPRLLSRHNPCPRKSRGRPPPPD